MMETLSACAPVPAGSFWYAARSAAYGRLSDTEK